MHWDYVEGMRYNILQNVFPYDQPNEWRAHENRVHKIFLFWQKIQRQKRSSHKCYLMNECYKKDIVFITSITDQSIVYLNIHVDNTKFLDT